MKASASGTSKSQTSEFLFLNRLEKIAWALVIPALYVNFTQTPKTVKQLFPNWQNLEGITSLPVQSHQSTYITVRYPDGRVEIYEKKWNGLYQLQNQPTE